MPHLIIIILPLWYLPKSVVEACLMLVQNKNKKCKCKTYFQIANISNLCADNHLRPWIAFPVCDCCQCKLMKNKHSWAPDLSIITMEYVRLSKTFHFLKSPRWGLISPVKSQQSFCGKCLLSPLTLTQELIITARYLNSQSKDLFSFLWFDDLVENAV